MGDYHSPDELRRYRNRLRRQREYQTDYRDRLRRERKPEREDVAVAWLDIALIRWATAPHDWDAINFLSDYLAEKKGFDRDRAREAVEGMVERVRRKNRRR
jgi:hypothetical protein